MQGQLLKLCSIATTALAFTAIATAQINLNDNICTSGYIAGAAQYTSSTTHEGIGPYSTSTLDVDVAKLLFQLNYSPVTGVFSLYYKPDQHVDILDAYVCYDTRCGIIVSGGKFTSWLGFEAFDPVDMYQISYANNDFLDALPTYHSGVRVEYSTGDYCSGVAVLDSVYSTTGPLKGDGELRHNQGFEAYLSYKGIKNVVLWSGVAYETRRTADTVNPNGLPAAPSIVTLDFWASYQLNDKTLFAAEFVNKNGEAQGARGYNWLFLANRTLTEKFSATARISGEHTNSYVDNYSAKPQPGFTKFTLAPAYNVSANLSILGEVSYYNYANYEYTDKTSSGNFSLDHSTYFAVQALFKF